MASIPPWLVQCLPYEIASAQQVPQVPQVSPPQRLEFLHTQVIPPHNGLGLLATESQPAVEWQVSHAQGHLLPPPAQYAVPQVPAFQPLPPLNQAQLAQLRLQQLQHQHNQQRQLQQLQRQQRSHADDVVDPASLVLPINRPSPSPSSMALTELMPSSDGYTSWTDMSSDVPWVPDYGYERFNSSPRMERPGPYPRVDRVPRFPRQDGYAYSATSTGRRRVRTVPLRTTKTQRQILDVEFAKNQYPSEEVLCRLVGLFSADGNATVPNLKAWFTDRRSKVNRAVRRSRGGSGDSVSSSSGGWDRRMADYLALTGHGTVLPVSAVRVGGWELVRGDMCAVLGDDVALVWRDGGVFRLVIRMDGVSNVATSGETCSVFVRPGAVELQAQAGGGAWAPTVDVSHGAIELASEVRIRATAAVVAQLCVQLRPGATQAEHSETAETQIPLSALPSPPAHHLIVALVGSSSDPSPPWDYDALSHQDPENPDATPTPNPTLVVTAESPALLFEPPTEPLQLSDEDLEILSSLVGDVAEPCPGPGAGDSIDLAAAADVTRDGESCSEEGVDAEGESEEEDVSGDGDGDGDDDNDDDELESPDKLSLSGFEAWFQYSSDVLQEAF